MNFPKRFSFSSCLDAARRHALPVIAVVGFFGLGVSAKADLVTNGNFEQTSLSSPGGYFCQSGSTCTSNVTGWSSTCNAGGCGNGSTVLSLLFANTNGSAFNGGIGLDGTIANSPDGGNFVAADGDPTYSAAFFQTINGLVAGQSYTLSFYQAAAQQKGSTTATTSKFQVSLGAQTQNSTIMDNPNQGFTPWNQQTMTFTATSTSEVLSFLAIGTPAGVPPVALLDDVSMTPTPEPAYFGIATIGLLGFVAIRRQKRVRA